MHKQRMWNVIRQYDDPITGELTSEKLIARFYRQDEAERYADKHPCRLIDGDVIVTRRQPRK